MPPARPHTEPLDVTPIDGEVMVHCPDGQAVAMTPEIALETGRRLIAGAATAVHQAAAAAARPEQDNLEEELAEQVAAAGRAWRSGRR